MKTPLKLDKYLSKLGISPALFGEACTPIRSRQNIENKIINGYLVGHVNGVFCMYHPSKIVPVPEYA